MIATQQYEAGESAIGGALLQGILDGLEDLYEQELLLAPDIDSWIVTRDSSDEIDLALPRADVVDLLGRASLVRAELAAGVRA